MQPFYFALVIYRILASKGPGDNAGRTETLAMRPVSKHIHISYIDNYTTKFHGKYHIVEPSIKEAYTGE
jgi:hypothetical protein